MMYQKNPDESILGKYGSLILMYYDLHDLRSLILILILPKERTLQQQVSTNGAVRP